MSVYRLLLSDRTLIRMAVNSVSYLTVMPVQRERGGRRRREREKAIKKIGELCRWKYNPATKRDEGEGRKVYGH